MRPSFKVAGALIIVMGDSVALSVERALQKAKKHLKKGERIEAKAIYLEVLERFPKNIRVADALKALEDADASVSKPLPNQVLTSLVGLYSQGKVGEVIERGEPLVKEFSSAKLHSVLGAAYTQLGKAAAAKEHFIQAIALDPNDPETYSNLGNVLGSLGERELAITNLEKAIDLRPNFAEAYNNLGNVYKDLGRTKDAIESYTKATRINPKYADAYNNLGVVLKAAGHTDIAIKNYEKAIALNPEFVMAHVNLGFLLQEHGKYDLALNRYKKVLALDPKNHLTYGHIGNIFRAIGMSDQAIQNYDQCLKIEPNYFPALFNMGSELVLTKKMREAHGYFAAAQKAAPRYEPTLSSMADIEAQICDWTDWDDKTAASVKLGLGGQSIPPFILLPREDDPAHHLQRAKNFSKLRVQKGAPAAIPRPKERPKRLRIGYFSSDFFNHATMILMERMLELHDKERFSIHAFSYGNVKDETSGRLEGMVEKLHKVSSLNDGEIAALSREQEIDIAVDLKGYTGQSRVEIFSHQAAPIQISYLGYPGTLGIPNINYIVADPVVIPENQQKNYSEKVIYLPHCYQVNDDTRKIATKVPTRAECNLPEDGFVFCCFNKNYKISPREFDIWMRLLAKVEGSVLWLYASNPEVKENLKKEAEARGISADRIIFGERVKHAAHLARHACADLFLDTFFVNAHTTASDALWSGLPLITKVGQGFAARVAASLLTSIGLPELIVESDEAYEALALELATNPAKLLSLKNKLAENRGSSPLFDTERFTRNLEQGYLDVYEQYFAGQAPKNIVIKE